MEIKFVLIFLAAFVLVALGLNYLGGKLSAWELEQGRLADVARIATVRAERRASGYYKRFFYRPEPPHYNPESSTTYDSRAYATTPSRLQELRKACN